MPFRPHLGTLLFPPVALLYLPQVFGSRNLTGDAMDLCGLGAVLVLGILAGISWRFLRHYPSIGVYFSGCVMLLFPFQELRRNNDLLGFLLGGAGVVGLIGIVYFGVRGIWLANRGPAVEPRGFPVFPRATHASHGHDSGDVTAGPLTPRG